MPELTKAGPFCKEPTTSDKRTKLPYVSTDPKS